MGLKRRENGGEHVRKRGPNWPGRRALPEEVAGEWDGGSRRLCKEVVRLGLCVAGGKLKNEPEVGDDKDEEEEERTS